MNTVVIVLLVLAIIGTIAREVVFQKRYRMLSDQYTKHAVVMANENAELKQAGLNAASAAADHLTRLAEENVRLEGACVHALGAVEYAGAELVFAKRQIEQLVS